MREKAKKVKEEQERLLQSHMDVSSRAEPTPLESAHDPYGSFVQKES